MDHSNGFGSNIPQGSVDKTKVLEVKPLRRLTPLFPNPNPNSNGMSLLSNPTPTPFVCVSPSGPFPPGITPFYPFSAQNDLQQGTPFMQTRPLPSNSFRTPPNRAKVSTPCPSKSAIVDEDDSQNPHGSGVSMDVDFTSNSGKRKVRSSRRTSNNNEGSLVDSLLNSILTSFKVEKYSESRRMNGDKDTVATILSLYSLLHRRLTQLEEAKELSGRPYLKAANLLMKRGIRTNSSKRIGHVPGIEIGDIFFFRMELCLVGLHAQSMGGIDYMGGRVSMNEEPLAVGIVSSGGYEDEVEEGDVLIYTGQGGVQRPDGQMFDQKLERGNLALEKSLHRANDVRVFRGVKDFTNASGSSKIYVYDGLYKIQESWAEKNNSECILFKYKLVRNDGQPEAFTLWKSIQQWKDKASTPNGMILRDLTTGVENLPVSLVNDVDCEKGPTPFTYVKSPIYSIPFPTSSKMGCQCTGKCGTNCPCNQRNDGYLPYSSIGVLLTNKSPIHECGHICGCAPNCRNRMSQAGIKLHLEVFKTRNRGWGLRSWDPIRSGSFICVYAGDVIEASYFKNRNDDDYIFDATRSYEHLVGYDSSNKGPFPIVISAKNNGNVARFMNHSCEPNVFWQPVLRESRDGSFLHVAFFANRHIPPMQELTFDYGSVPSERGDAWKKKCTCGSLKCRGYFY